MLLGLHFHAIEAFDEFEGSGGILLGGFAEFFKSFRFFEELGHLQVHEGDGVTVVMGGVGLGDAGLDDELEGHFHVGEHLLHHGLHLGTFHVGHTGDAWSLGCGCGGGRRGHGDGEGAAGVGKGDGFRWGGGCSGCHRREAPHAITGGNGELINIGEVVSDGGPLVATGFVGDGFLDGDARAEGGGASLGLFRRGEIGKRIFHRGATDGGHLSKHGEHPGAVGGLLGEGAAAVFLKVDSGLTLEATGQDEGNNGGGKGEDETFHGFMKLKE